MTIFFSMKPDIYYFAILRCGLTILSADNQDQVGCIYRIRAGNLEKYVAIFDLFSLSLSLT